MGIFGLQLLLLLPFGVQGSAILQLSLLFEAVISDGGIMSSSYGGASSSGPQGYGISNVDMSTMVDRNQPMYMNLPISTVAELDIEPLEVIENEPLHIPWPRFLSQSSRTQRLDASVDEPPEGPTQETWNQPLELQNNMYQAQLQLSQLGQALAQSEIQTNFDRMAVSGQAGGSGNLTGKFDQKHAVSSNKHGSATDPGRVRMVRIPVADVNKNADHTRGKKTKGMKFFGFEGPSRRKQEKQEMRNRQSTNALANTSSNSSTEISAGHPPFQLQ